MSTAPRVETKAFLQAAKAAAMSTAPSIENHVPVVGVMNPKRLCQKSCSLSFQCYLEAEVEIQSKKGIRSLKKTHGK